MTTTQAAELKQSSQMKTIIERGASWTLEETKLLLTLWGQDQIARKDTPHKRTKEVYEKISEKFNQSGFERTPDQVRTRVFNMIAEYRRIIKDPSPEKKKKCIFFEAMHKIYRAQHWSEVKPLIDDNDAECPPCSPLSNSKLSETMDESISDSEMGDGSQDVQSSMDSSNASNNLNNNNNANAATSSRSAVKVETTTNAAVAAATTTSINNTSNNGNSGGGTNFKASATSDNIVNNSINDNRAASTSTNLAGPNSKANEIVNNSIIFNNASASSSNSTGFNNRPNAPNNNIANNNDHSARKAMPSRDCPPAVAAKRTKIELPTTAAVTSHLLYQAPVNTFDVTSSALLIDRMFAHLSRESENMREWIALEKDRIALEKARRAQESEREIRRERVLIETLMKFQEQWISFVGRLDPRILENTGNSIPQLNIPPREPEPLQQGPSSLTNHSATTTNSLMNATSVTPATSGQTVTATVATIPSTRPATTPSSTPST